MMKKIIILIVAVGCVHMTFGQAEVSAKMEAKTYARNSRLQFADLINEGQLAKARSEINRALEECQALTDETSCTAGVYFTAGWLYHQAAKARQESDQQTYFNIALDYYDQVLDIVPENEVALSYKLEILASLGADDQEISKIKELLLQQPRNRIKYLVRLGNIYLENGDLSTACSYFQEAYAEDYFSAEACGALVKLHTRTDHSCLMGNNVIYFAYDCQSIGLPNYAVDLLEHDIGRSVRAGSASEIEQAIICWADVMAENGWLTSAKIDNLLHRYFYQENNPDANSRLLELKSTVSASTSPTERRNNFWYDKRPRIEISPEGNYTSPLRVRLKIWHQQANRAYFAGDLSEAEKFWQEALKDADRGDNGMYTLIAKNLAQLYSNQSDLDPDETKFNHLVKRLMDMKLLAYTQRDRALIREYHITLGSIFYQHGKWKGNRLRNAEYQLSRALSDDLGAIFDPELRKMLAHTYHEVGKPDLALEQQLLAVQDHLSLDQLDEARTTIDQVRESNVTNDADKWTSTLNALDRILQLRNEWISQQHPQLSADGSVFEYLAKMAAVIRACVKHLDTGFVHVQFFKVFSDLATQMTTDKVTRQQILYAEALQQINNLSILPSLSDFHRLQRIKSSLSQSLSKPGQMPIVKTRQQADLNYDRHSPAEEMRTYELPNLSRTIEIPARLFKLREEIQRHYDGDEKMGMPRIDLNN